MKKLLILAAIILSAGSAAAQQKNDRQSPRVQFGLRAGVFSQDIQLKKMSEIMTDAKLGWNAAFVARLRLTAVGTNTFGLGLYLQPEVVYSQNNYKIQPKGGEVTRISLRDVDVPVLLSFQIAIVRIQAGPVFNVMHKTPTESGEADFSSIRPTVGYAVGASIDIFKGLVLDGRFNGNFKQMQDNIKMGDEVYDGIKSSLSSWSLGLSYLF